MLFMTDKLLKFFESFAERHPEFISRIAMIKINYIYYKNDTLYKTIRTRLADKADLLKDTYAQDNS